jgi:tRNA modification GTPase
MPATTDTIAAPATPLGTAAIAMVRASGPDVGGLARDIFGASLPPRMATHGDYRDKNGRLVDDVVGTFFAGPNSYTGEDTLEICCHGNPLIVQKIMADLIARGCRVAEAGEFTKRAFLNGRMDLGQAEAVMDLIHARSERAMAAANRQLRGALGRHMEKLVARLLDVVATVEAYIDFPEEDLPPEDARKLTEQVEWLRVETGRLLATHGYGKMLREGIRTVIFGETNVGKSSLLNRLLGEERALVSAEPGTTRDYIESDLRVGAHWLRLVDTAGFNETSAGLEHRGIEKSMEQVAEADLYLWVVEAGAPLPSLQESIRARLRRSNTLIVANKSDLPHSLASTSRDAGDLEVVAVSALRGDGLDQFLQAVNNLAETMAVEAGAEAVTVNARHARSLDAARRALDEAHAKIAAGECNVLLASDLRTVLHAFGEISGRVDNEQMLDRLFSSFCIGK